MNQSHETQGGTIKNYELLYSRRNYQLIPHNGRKLHTSAIIQNKKLMLNNQHN